MSQSEIATLSGDAPLQPEAVAAAEVLAFPVSFAQQRLWFLDKLEGGSFAYNIPVAVRLNGSLNRTALASALNEVIRRHEALRTSFSTVDSQPVQIIHDYQPLTLPVVDLGGLSEEEREAEVQRRAVEEAQHPFDLARGQLVRAQLLCLSEQHHVALLTMHHIISDGWSCGVLIREIVALYEAYSLGAESPLPELPIQYADYAVWQREWLQGEVLQEQLAYWKEQLKDAPALLELPLDRPRPAMQTASGAALSFQLTAELSEKLKELSREEGATLFMALLAAFQLLLSRYSGQVDIVVGTPIAGRSQGETEALIGLFVNTLLLRTKVRGEESFREVLRQVREKSLGAYAHQDVPFEKLVDELEVERSLNRTPLFQVMFALQNMPTTTLTLSNLTFEVLEIDSKAAKFDLTLSMVEDEEQHLNGILGYNTDLFDASTISRLAAHFQTLLTSIVSNPAQRISELEMLSEAERQQLLVEFNDTHCEYPQDICLHQLFEQQVERSPDALALTFEDEHLTYAQLNARANQLAHYLQSHGIGVEDRVGVLLERSVEMVVSLLAILKAGAAYVPLDPAYPQERLAFTLADSTASLLLSRSSLLDSLSLALPDSLPLLALDRSDTEIASHSRDNLTSPVLAENLAYLIYTSGSTGTPKGVAITHHSASTLIHWSADIYSPSQLSGVLASTSICFDLSVWELFVPLALGGRVLLAHNALELPTLAARDEVRLINTVPSAMAELVRQRAIPRSVEVINLAGEALSERLVKEIYEQSAEVEVNNLYGPSEDTTYSTWERVRLGERVTIGRPVANTQVYILDGEMKPVGVGVRGEVYLGGEGLARGYLNQPGMTAERFIPHPFSHTGGARLYRTGDVGRYRADGEIEYLGRTDQQVKIRGFRIELGEIESVLCQHEQVREAIVVAQETMGGGGQQRLVGYVVAEDGGELQTSEMSTSELRRYLGEKLPEHMIPSVFIQLAELPLTPNGKVDRRALPAPDASRLTQENAFVAPRTPVEEQLCAIWQQVLGLEQVGIHDNFFSLGGDSILSIQIVARANQAGLSLSPRLLFQHQTVAALAGVAGSAQEVRAEQGRVSGQVPLTPIQHWFFEQVEVERQHWNQSVLLESRNAELDGVALRKAVQQVVTHHDALRMKFRESAQEWEQECLERAPEPVPLTIVDLTAASFAASASANTSADYVEQRRRLIESAANQAQRSLSLSNGELLRVVLFECGQGQPPRLLIVIHHLVIDGVSWRVLLEDLETAYEQARRGERVKLPPKTTSFKQWAEALTEYAHSPAVQQQSDYWLRAAEAVHHLPRDFHTSSGEMLDESEATSAHVLVRLSRAETRALLQEVPSTYHTEINDVLLTTLAQALANWSAERSVLIELEGHGREDISTELDISRTVGWFTTLYPVRLQLSESRSVGEDLKAVKEQLRGVPERGLGYGLLKYVGGDEETRQRLREVRAEVAFNYLGQLDNVVSEERMFRGAKESSGESHSRKGQRSHALTINSSVQGGELVLAWSYSKQVHARETIERVAAEQVERLRQVIEHCREEESGGYTPSDFPLARLNQRELDEVVGTERKVEDIYPLSPMQQGMLFHSVYAAGSGMYFEQMSCVLEGEVNGLAFEQAWQAVVDRHSVLRSSFIWEELGEPVQLVKQGVEIAVAHEDWRALSAVEQAARLEILLQEDREEGFDFAQPPLMRLTLVRLSEERHQLIWSHHHLLFDGWSMPLLLKEVFTCYEALARGEALHLPAPRPYRDYIQWLQGQDMGRAEEFWRERLRGFSSSTQLSIERPSAVVDTRAEADGNGHEQGHGEQRVSLSEEATAQLHALARHHQLTLNTIVQGAWALLLSRYSGNSDVLFGATVSGRPAELSGVEQMLGLFINTLPVRVHVGGGERVIEWLQQMQAEEAQAREYEYTPLVEVQRWSEIERGQALFDSILVFENYPVETGLNEEVNKESTGLAIGEVSSFKKTNYPLTLMVATGSRLRLLIGYDQEQFADDVIERMLGHLGVVLEQMGDNVEQRIAELEMLSEAEHQQLLVEFNDTITPYPQDLCLHQLFEQQVERTPDALALSFEDEHLTYAELNARANQLAHYLQAQGISLEDRVGVLVQRSVEMVVALLGVLKAGAAYVPLDPQYPQSRLTFMLADANIKALLTQQSLLHSLPEHQARTVCLDTDWPLIAQQSVLPTNNLAVVDNLAYTIYTSGSTGLPKGVQVAHRQLVNFICSMQERPGLQPHDRLLAVTTLCFDIAALELYLPLCTGAQVIVCAREAAMDGMELRRLMQQHEVTVMQATPASWRMLIESGWSGSAGLKVLCGGEALAQELAERLRSRCAELWNMYGPTETTVWSAVAEVGVDVKQVVLGEGIANTELYIVDERMKVVPIGVRGELYIGGEGVARGYLNRPELTAERFVPHPFSASEGARLYRTGDMARRLSDGQIEFLGRADQQVKIRGFRIELGEIEAVLYQHERVREAVVVAQEAAAGQQRLVGYVVAEDGEALSTGDLRKHLSEKLPEHMIPSVFMLLDELPHTPNGKLDRRALPVPDSARPDLQHCSFVAPTSPLERDLANMWSGLLGVEQIGIQDNFFELGGHSLIAMQLVSRVRADFDLEIGLRDFFQRPTIEELAKMIEEAFFASSEDGKEMEAMLSQLEEIEEEEAQRMVRGEEQNAL